ncbi:hypothetical protein XFF6991_130008 [Xanthomonas phaseoli pv. phaseoli]|uniref:Uncharacterized protein n=1 Tax=Xanthomonas campestris pv. phaseoli TaxID=317013 RepID=A0A7Z7NFL3_XANCH|nr:hypothetical protein XFF6991_130008 [Xanthomonas phaseoli pv. phaseoli]
MRAAIVRDLHGSRMHEGVCRPTVWQLQVPLRCRTCLVSRSRLSRYRIDVVMSAIEQETEPPLTRQLRPVDTRRSTAPMRSGRTRHPAYQAVSNPLLMRPRPQQAAHTTNAAMRHALQRFPIPDSRFPP